jgi:hypothetical protein
MYFLRVYVIVFVHTLREKQEGVRAKQMPIGYEENDTAGETFSSRAQYVSLPPACAARHCGRGVAARRDRPVGIPLQQLATQIFFASGTAGLISVECDPDCFHGYLSRRAPDD